MELYGMLGDELAIRIAAKKTVIPNIEIKFIKSDLDKASLDEHKVVNIGKDTINISPIELQIAFKLYLGSDKDIEDAVYLYEIFIKYIDKNKLNQYMNILKVKGAKYGIEI